MALNKTFDRGRGSLESAVKALRACQETDAQVAQAGQMANETWDGCSDYDVRGAAVKIWNLAVSTGVVDSECVGAAEIFSKAML